MAEPYRLLDEDLKRDAALDLPFPWAGTGADGTDDGTQMPPRALPGQKFAPNGLPIMEPGMLIDDENNQIVRMPPSAPSAQGPGTMIPPGMPSGVGPSAGPSHPAWEAGVRGLSPVNGPPPMAPGAAAEDLRRMSNGPIVDQNQPVPGPEGAGLDRDTQEFNARMRAQASAQGAMPNIPGPYDPREDIAQIHQGLDRQGRAGERIAKNEAEALDWETKIRHQADEAADFEVRRKQYAAQVLDNRVRNFDQKQTALEDQIQATHIDPSKYWDEPGALGTTGVGKRIVNALTVFLGGLGGGPNQVMASINRDIDRSLELQREDLKNLKDAHQIRENGLASSLMAHREVESAYDGARLAALGQVERQVQNMQRTYASANVQQNAQILLGQIQSQKADIKYKMMDRFAQEASKDAYQQALLGTKLKSSATSFAAAGGRTSMGPEGVPENVQQIGAAIETLVPEKQRAGAMKELGVLHHAELVRRDADSQFTRVLSNGTMTIPGTPANGEFRAIQASMAGHIRELASQGRISMGTLESLEGLIPAWGDSPARVADKRREFDALMKSNVQSMAPTLYGLGIIKGFTPDVRAAPRPLIRGE